MSSTTRSTPRTVSSWPTQAGTPEAVGACVGTAGPHDAGLAASAAGRRPARRLSRPRPGSETNGMPGRPTGRPATPSRQRRQQPEAARGTSIHGSQSSSQSPSASSSRCGVRGPERDVRLRRALGDAGVCMLRSSEPKMWCTGTRRNSSGARRERAGGAAEAQAGSPPCRRRRAGARPTGPAAQRPVDLLLELVQAAGRVPAGRPRARQQRRRRLIGPDALEREGERRVRVADGRAARARRRRRPSAVRPLKRRGCRATSAPARRQSGRRRRRGDAAELRQLASPARRSRRRRRASRAPPGGRAAP